MAELRRDAPHAGTSSDPDQGKAVASRAQVLAGLVMGLIVASMVCVAVAPTLMPDSYSWTENSVSESAGQGIERAWLARFGFLFLAFAVLILSGIAGSLWGTWGRLAHRIYGISLIAAAAFAAAPWEEVPYDEFEDLLHSVAAFAVGFSFSAGVVLVSIHRDPRSILLRVFDWAAVAAAVVLPMVMFNVDSIGGLVQRMLFLIAYLWYGAEAIRAGRYRETAR